MFAMQVRCMRWLPRWPCNESSPTVCHYSLSSGVPLAQADSAEVQPPSSLSPAIAHAVWIVFGRCVACPAPPCPARQAWVIERFGKFHVLEPGLKLSCSSRLPSKALGVNHFISPDCTRVVHTLRTRCATAPPPAPRPPPPVYNPSRAASGLLSKSRTDAAKILPVLAVVPTPTKPPTDSALPPPPTPTRPRAASRPTTSPFTSTACCTAICFDMIPGASHADLGSYTGMPPRPRRVLCELLPQLPSGVCNPMS